jgi:hypothetical protein
MKNKNELKNKCPKEYCFLWREEGNQIARGVYMNLEDAFKNLELVEQSHCGCSFGICKRNEEFRDSNASDYYEPNDVQLGKNGLPWFYFVDYNQLSEKDKKQYDMFFVNLYKD